MSVKQSQLQFPIRKSSRCRQKYDKENTKPNKANDVLPTDGLVESYVRQEATPKSQSSKKKAHTPSKREAAADVDDSSPSKRHAKCVTPFSPSKCSNAIAPTSGLYLCQSLG